MEMSERAKYIKANAINPKLRAEIEADKSGRVNEILNAVCQWVAENE